MPTITVAIQFLRRDSDKEYKTKSRREKNRNNDRRISNIDVTISGRYSLTSYAWRRFANKMDYTFLTLELNINAKNQSTGTQSTKKTKHLYIL